MLMRKRNFSRAKSLGWIRSVRSYFTQRIHNLSPRQRIVSGVIAGVLVVAAVVPVVYQLIDVQRYKLDASTKELIGNVNQNLAAKLTYSSESSQWEFNATGISSASSEPVSLASLKTKVGGGGAQDETLYATTFAEDPTQGVSFFDTQTQLSFKMTPQFNIKAGRSIDGRLVYPMQKGAKLIYTPKNNGMKEDIVLPHFIGKELAYSYQLDLPDALDARIQADGSIGIFSANPALFGNIATSDTEDVEKLKSAREQAKKDYLLFAIPAPVIVQSGDKTTKATARFGLSGDTLTVTAREMDTVQYPASIDPSVVVTSTSDLTTAANSEDNIDFSTADQAQRTAVVSGLVNNTWSTTTSLPAASEAMGSALYNDRIYLVGGSANGANVYYSQIAGNGTLGEWTSTESTTAPRTYPGVAAFNGYLYVWGGYNTSSNAASSSVEYAKINSNGSLGPWQTTTSMHTAVCRAGAAAYNGYLYAFGGSTSPSSGCSSASNGATSTVQYAPLRANGSVGPWQTTTNIAYGSSGAVISPMAGAHNGYMYLAGGHNNGGGTAYSNVQYAAINNDGSLSAWLATTSLPSATYGAGFAVQNGYITTISNQAGATTQQYTQIYASGKVGQWFSTSIAAMAGRANGAYLATKTYAYYIGGAGPTATAHYTTLMGTGGIKGKFEVTTTFTSNRERMAAVAHKGCLILVGGYGSNSNTYVNYAQSSPINDDGNITTSWPNKGFSNSRADLAAVAYNGYLYVMGGYNGNTDTYYSDVQYVPINNDCTLGTWASTTSFDTAGNARGGISAAVHNGYMYVTGGKRGSTDFATVRYAPINSNGTVGSWSSTTNLPTAVNRHRTLISGNRIYTLGGTQLALPNLNNGASTGSRPTGAGYNNVYFATINSDGTIGSWQSTTSMIRDLYEFGAEIVDGYIYTAGGFTSFGTGTTDYYYYAPINTDGTLGSWAGTLSTGTDFASTPLVSHNGFLYSPGGRTDNNTDAAHRLVRTQYVNTHNAGSGKVNTWTSGNALSQGRTYAGSTAYNGRLYTVGGTTDGGSTASDDIERSTIVRQSGAIGSFSVDSQPLDTGVMSPGVAAYDGYLYVVGGKTASSRQGSVQYAPIGTNGSLSDDFTTTGSFVTGSGSDTGREGGCTVAYNNRLYVVGGWDGTNYHDDVRYATIGSNGAPGSWGDSGSNFSGTRANAGCSVIGGRLYVFGGRGSSVYSDVQYAPINNNGTLGSWTTTAGFMGGRSHFISGYSNGFLYIYGGCTTTACSAGYGDIQRSSVNSDGSLNAWQIQSPATDTPYATTGLIYGGYLYQLGGSGLGGGANATAYAPLNVVARTARYSKLIDLGAPAQVNGISFSGSLKDNSYTPGTSPVSFRSALDNGVLRSSVVDADHLPQSAEKCDIANPAYARYLFVTVALDDTFGGTFPDTSGTPANFTDITIDYSPVHAEPQKRLARGKSFQGESLQALDTCSS